MNENRNFTPENVAKLYREGLPARAIAVRMELPSVFNVYKALRDSGEKRRKTGQPVIRPSPGIDKLRKLLEHHHTQSQVAKMYGVNRSMVQKWLKQGDGEGTKKE